MERKQRQQNVSGTHCPKILAAPIYLVKGKKMKKGNLRKQNEIKQRNPTE